MIARFAPIPCPLPEERKAGPHIVPPVLEFARAQPCYEGMDDMADYAVQHRDDRSYLERRQDEIDEDREIEAAEWEARDRFIEGYDA